MIAAAIEIDGSTSQPLQERLLSSAYRLSRTAPVVLMLNGIDRQRVDRLLDKVVALEGTRFAGVRYVDDMVNADAMAVVAHHAATVITSTVRVFSRLREAGVPAELLSENEVLERLETRL
jgi:hypothetical protein